MAFENGSRVMNGTFGTVWADGSEIAEISAFQLKVAKNFDPINMCGQMAEDRKLTGIKITGSMTLHKVYSRGAEDVNAANRGHDVRRTLVAKLADPDAYGAERVALYNCSFDDETIMDFQHGQLGKTTHPFTFTKREWLDVVKPQ